MLICADTTPSTMLSAYLVLAAHVICKRKVCTMPFILQTLHSSACFVLSHGEERDSVAGLI